jgi:phosphoenolpyruvate carboxykinase (ATP)
VWWDNNGAMTAEQFDNLYADFWKRRRARICSCRISSAAPIRPIAPTRVITEYAWHSLFIRNLLIRPRTPSWTTFVPT